MFVGSCEIVIELGSPEAFAYFPNGCEQTERLTYMNYSEMEKVRSLEAWNVVGLWFYFVFRVLFDELVVDFSTKLP